MSMASHEKTTLNVLIATTLDSIDDFLDAADNVESDSLVALFDQRVIACQAVMDTLRCEVIRLGGSPQRNGSLSASAHRVFSNLKSAMTGRNEQAIIVEVATCESHLKAKFADAMADTRLSPEVRRTIRDCYAAMTLHHRHAENFRQALESDQAPPEL